MISLSNLDSITEPTLIPIPIDLEIEPPILDSHILLMDLKCELKFFDLDPTPEPKLTLKPKLDFLSQYWFLNLSFLSPSEPFTQVTFYCWTKVFRNDFSRLVI